MPDNPSDTQTVGHDKLTDKQLRSESPGDKLANLNDRRQRAIRNLLENSPVGVDDKLTTVKAAHHVDKDRFQSAFRSLMRGGKP